MHIAPPGQSFQDNLLFVLSQGQTDTKQNRLIISKQTIDEKVDILTSRTNKLRT